VICSFLVLIHYPYADGRELVANLAGLLKSGGILAIQCPIYDRARQPVGWTSVGVWTADQFTTAAEDAGLEVVSMTTNRGRYRPGKGGRHHGAIQVLHRSE